MKSVKRSYGCYMWLRYAWLPLICLFATMLPAQEHPKPSDQVWVWSKQCDGKHKLAVTVHLDGKAIYHGVLSVCRGDRNQEDGRLRFHLTGGHIFEHEYRTRSSDSIEADLWQAGGDEDAVILGVSFSTNKQTLLNTLHVAQVNIQATSELDKGITITTDPISLR